MLMDSRYGSCSRTFWSFHVLYLVTVISLSWTNFHIGFLVLFQAFNTLVRNALDLAVLNSIGNFILFLGKCLVTTATGSHLHFYAIPTLVVCIFSYFIAQSVLSLYEVRHSNCVSVKWFLQSGMLGSMLHQNLFFFNSCFTFTYHILFPNENFEVIFSMFDTCYTHHILLDLVTLIILREEYIL
jgi:hypothetical protein